MKRKVRLTESDLHRVIKESVNTILNERKPADRTIGKHVLKGLRYDKNGNPLYTSDTMSDDEKKAEGWRFSKKHGFYGQLQDPTTFCENFDLDKFENQKQEYDRMVNTYECEMTYEEIEGIKQSISMIQQLVNSFVKNGYNNDKLLDLLNKHIKNIKGIVEYK